jgi:hypothetical protein
LRTPTDEPALATVLSERAVHDWEHDVDLPNGRDLCRRRGRGWQLHGQARLHADKPRVALTREELLGILREPASVFIDANGDRLEAGTVKSGQDIARRQDRDLMLGGLTAEEKRDSDLSRFRHLRWA